MAVYQYRRPGRVLPEDIGPGEPATIGPTTPEAWRQAGAGEAAQAQEEVPSLPRRMAQMLWGAVRDPVWNAVDYGQYLGLLPGRSEKYGPGYEALRSPPPQGLSPDDWERVQRKVAEGLAPRFDPTTLMGVGMPFEGQAGFYSAAEKALEATQRKRGQGMAWLNELMRAPNVKKEELEWMGLPEWLKQQKGDIQKSQVADFMRQRKVEIPEVTLGKPTQPKWQIGGEDIAPGDPKHVALQEVQAYGPGYVDEMRRHTERMAHNLNNSRLTSEDVNYWQDRLAQARQKLEDVIWAEEKTRTGQAQYIPGKAGAKYGGNMYPPGPAENYSNILQYQPSRAMASDEPGRSFVSGHFPNIPEGPGGKTNVRLMTDILHDRQTLASNETIPFMHESQSDLHQQAGERGYEGAEKTRYVPHPAEQPGRYHIRDMWSDNPQPEIIYGRQSGHTLEEAQALANQYNAQNTQTYPSPPNAPFKGLGWQELNLKRMIMEATGQGKNVLGWPTGAMLGERYQGQRPAAVAQHILRQDTQIPNVIKSILGSKNVTIAQEELAGGDKIWVARWPEKVSQEVRSKGFPLFMLPPAVLASKLRDWGGGEGGQGGGPDSGAEE